VTFDEIVSGVRSEAGIDATPAVVGGWINQRYRTMVAKARWRMAEVVVASTTAGQSSYAVSDDIVDLEGLLVGEQPYDPTGVSTMWGLKSGRQRLGCGGVFAPKFDSSAVESIELYPVPDTDGVAITGLAAMLPPALSGSDEPQIPVDLHEALRDGAIATGLRLEDERIPEADSFEQRFLDGVAELGRRKNSRLSHGPTQIMVAGRHF
jgi:hypothetical protein